MGRVHGRVVPRGVDADAQAAQAARHSGEVVGHGQLHRGGVVGVGSRDRTEQGACVSGAARHRANVVQRRGEFEHAEAAHPTPGGLDTRQAIGGTREADRPAGVGAQRSVAQAGRRGHARTAGRRARPMRCVPWIDGHRDLRVMVGVGTFGELQLAHDHRAGAAQALHDGRVLIGLEVGVDRHARGSGNALGPAQVLHRDRRAMQRATNLALRDFGVGAPRVGQRAVGHQGGVALERTVELLNATELRLGRVNARNFARLNAPRDVEQFEIVPIGGCSHAQKSGIGVWRCPTRNTFGPRSVLLMRRGAAREFPGRGVTLADRNARHFVGRGTSKALRGVLREQRNSFV